MFMEALDVDEVVGQLLASEGFGSVEELAVVDEKELASIEGFDEDTARELQTRAKEYLGKIEGELDAKRKELGVEDAVKDVPGVTTAMLVKLGEGGIKTVEDLAGCATDDLVGWTERKDGESKREPGILDGYRNLARGRRGDDHAGPCEGRLGHRGRSRAAAAAEAEPAESRSNAGLRTTSHRCWHATPARRRARRRTAQRRRRHRAAVRRHPRR